MEKKVVEVVEVVEDEEFIKTDIPSLKTLEGMGWCLIPTLLHWVQIVIFTALPLWTILLNILLCLWPLYQHYKCGKLYKSIVKENGHNKKWKGARQLVFCSVACILILTLIWESGLVIFASLAMYEILVVSILCVLSLIACYLKFRGNGFYGNLVLWNGFFELVCNLCVMLFFFPLWVLTCPFVVLFLLIFIIEIKNRTEFLYYTHAFESNDCKIPKYLFLYCLILSIIFFVLTSMQIAYFFLDVAWKMIHFPIWTIVLPMLVFCLLIVTVHLIFFDLSTLKMELIERCQNGRIANEKIIFALCLINLFCIRCVTYYQLPFWVITFLWFPAILLFLHVFSQYSKSSNGPFANAKVTYQNHSEKLIGLNQGIQKEQDQKKQNQLKYKLVKLNETDDESNIDVASNSSYL